MKSLFLAMAIITGFLLQAPTLIAQTSGGVPEGITAALKAGNSREFSRFFNTNIELLLPNNNEGVYSRTQAELIIKDFFAKNPPSNFVILHQGGRENSRYAIGSLSTSRSGYRIYFLLKMTDGVALIHQLRIEREED